MELLLSWCRQLSEAEKFLVQHGVVHLDMKLNNILVSQDGVLKICDFGFAVQLQPSDFKMRLTQGMAPGGNPAHLAPEVLNAARRAGMLSQNHYGSLMCFLQLASCCAKISDRISIGLFFTPDSLNKKMKCNMTSFGDANKILTGEEVHIVEFELVVETFSSG